MPWEVKASPSVQQRAANAGYKNNKHGDSHIYFLVNLDICIHTTAEGFQSLVSNVASTHLYHKDKEIGCLNLWSLAGRLYKLGTKYFIAKV